MSNLEIVDMLARDIEFVPVEGKRSVYTIKVKDNSSAEGKMTEEDWDKFERDVLDARELVR